MVFGPIPASSTLNHSSIDTNPNPTTEWRELKQNLVVPCAFFCCASQMTPPSYRLSFRPVPWKMATCILPWMRSGVKKINIRIDQLCSSLPACCVLFFALAV